MVDLAGLAACWSRLDDRLVAAVAAADRRSPHYWDRAGAGVVPPAGTALEFPGGVGVWRATPGGPILHEAPLGGSIGRAGAERGHYSATGHGALPAGPGHQRAHTLRQGTGFESPYGIYYAPEFVNQRLQNRGIESFMRGLADRRRPGETFRVTTTTSAHPDGRPLSHVGYRVQVVVDGKLHDVATYDIHVRGTRDRPVVEASPIRFADNAVAREIQAGAAPPEVITRPVRQVADGSPISAPVAPRRRMATPSTPAARPAAFRPGRRQAAGRSSHRR